MESFTVNTRSIGPLSDDQLFQLCQENPNLRIERKANGQLIFMTPTGGTSSNLNAIIIAKLYYWNEKYQSGVVFDSSGGFRLPDGSMLGPDAAWLKKARWEVLPQEAKDKFPPLCPDFVIELRSKSDSITELQEKMETWIKNGAQSAWLIDPIEKKAYIYKSNANVAITDSFNEILQDEDVLPDFQLNLSDIKK